VAPCAITPRFDIAAARAKNPARKVLRREMHMPRVDEDAEIATPKSVDRQHQFKEYLEQNQRHAPSVGAAVPFRIVAAIVPPNNSWNFFQQGVVPCSKQLCGTEMLFLNGRSRLMMRSADSPER